MKRENYIRLQQMMIEEALEDAGINTKPTTCKEWTESIKAAVEKYGMAGGKMISTDYLDEDEAGEEYDRFEQYEEGVFSFSLNALCGELDYCRNFCISKIKQVCVYNGKAPEGEEIKWINIVTEG